MKFKAWHKKWNKWVQDELDIFINSEGEVIEYYHHGYEIANRDISKDVEIVFYTGLKDKNGKEIYEGDIIRVNKLTFESKNLPENLLVKFYGGMFQLYRGNENLMGLHLQYVEDGEIIGNIYENADLLAEVTP